MASFNSNMYNSQSASQQGNSAKNTVGDLGGRVRSIYFSVNTATAVMAINDVINLFKLPKGARVVDWKVLCPSTGTTGIFKLGNAVSSDAAEAADDDAFGAGYDAGGQAVLAVPDVTNDGLFKRVAAEVAVTLTWTEATDVGGVDIKGVFHYVID